MHEIMKTDMNGNLVTLTKTLPGDIGRILEIERENSRFVHGYPEEKHLALQDDPDCLHLSLRRRDNGMLAGYMILFGVTGSHRVLEFRRIAISDKGHGFGRDAIRLLKRLCFERLKFHRLWFDVCDDNSRAIALYESEGFVMEGILRENIRSGGGYRSQRIYSMLEHEYVPR